MIALIYSMVKLSKLIKHLKSFGLYLSAKTITTQLVLLATVCLVALITFGTQLRFWSDCNDKEVAKSWAGSVTRIFDMV